MTSTFSDLPAELMDHVASQIEDISTLRSLALTSKLLQEIAEPYIYRDIFLRKGQIATQLADTIDERNPKRAAAVRTIEARFMYRYAAGLDNLARAMRAATNLQELTIESPYCNRGMWRRQNGWLRTMGELMRPLWEASTMYAGPTLRTVPLQGLKKLVLHLNGEPHEFWDMEDRAACLFAHPSLEDITLSSVNFLEDALQAIPKNLKTPLKRISLDECKVTNKALSDMLALPTGLEQLYIGESVYSEDDEPVVPSMSSKPEIFFQALNQQSHSLQKLSYDASNEGRRMGTWIEPSYPAFETFEKLQEIQLGAKQNFLERLLSCKQKSPPNLKHLNVVVNVMIGGGAIFRYPEDVADALPKWIEDLLAAQPNLKKLDLTWEGAYETPILRSENKWAEATGYRIGERGVDFRLFITSPDVSIVRPVLYGEEEPPKFLACTSAKGWSKTPANLMPYDEVLEGDSDWEDSDDFDDDDGDIGDFDDDDDLDDDDD